MSIGLYSGIVFGLFGLVVGWWQSLLFRPFPRRNWIIGITALAYGLSWYPVLALTIHIQFVDYFSSPSIDEVAVIPAIHQAGTRIAIAQGLGLLSILGKPPRSNVVNGSTFP